MLIRKAKTSDVDEICSIIADAKAMLKNSGVDQWQNGYPNREVVKEDIDLGIAYVAEAETVCGYCVIVFGDDPNYQEIFDGNWKNNEMYTAVHRVCVSSKARGKGTAGELFAYAQGLCEKANIHNLKIDTHPENMAMQNALKKFGFVYCGKIRLLSPLEKGAVRYAYQKVF